LFPAPPALPELAEPPLSLEPLLLPLIPTSDRLNASGLSKDTRRGRLLIVSAAYATKGAVLGANKEAANSRLMALPKIRLLPGLFLTVFFSFYLFVNKRLSHSQFTYIFIHNQQMCTNCPFFARIDSQTDSLYMVLGTSLYRKLRKLPVGLDL
jgi:hypothetical protein